MNLKIKLLIILVLINTLLHAKDIDTAIFQRIIKEIPEGQVLTVSEFRGNFATEFTRDLKSYLTQNNIRFTSETVQRTVLEERDRHSEPIHDGRLSEFPSFTSPDLVIYGSAVLQHNRNFLFKQREHLDIEINIADLNTSLIILNLNERFIKRYNPPLLLLLIVVVLILTIARLIIHLKRGYNVFAVICVAMFLVALIVAWYLL